MRESFRVDRDIPHRVNPFKHFAINYLDPDLLSYLEHDSKEQINLADVPGYKNVLREMKSLLKEHLKNVPGTFGEFKTSL